MKSATRIILVEGFSRITMEEMARRLEVSKRTLYKYFPNKEKLISTIVDTELAGFRKKFDAVINNRDLEFPMKMAAILKSITEQLSRFSENVIRDIYHHAPGAWDKIHGFRKTFIFHRVDELFRTGIKKGYIRKDINFKIVLPIFFNTAYSLLNPEQILSMHVSAQDLFESLMKIIYGGILTDEARTEFLKSYSKDGVKGVIGNEK
ncbi:MAG: TetR/AcrR family transcriptional regulator [Spirochaetales bacterium]|nr:TetR/AcrR family transcriptional regulator [Spirochaetales bacterium]